MIKTIIFDLDNTIMEWKDEYISAYINTLNKLNIDYNTFKIKNIDEVIQKYEDENNIYTKDNFMKFINNNYGGELPNNFIDILLSEQESCYDINNEVIETIKYLSNKYELVVLSNWFTDTQRKRLEGAKIAKYFKLVLGGDKHELKPSLKAFDSFKNINECIMIGDSIKKDIRPALKLGMQAILITNNNVRKDLRYKRIKKLDELKEML